MKHLSEYINYNINEEEINEGFWSWFGDLIKSMFTDTSKETRNFGESIFKYYDDNFDTNVVDYNKKIFKEKDTNKFIALTDEMYQNFIDKKILDKVSFTVLKGDKICFLAEDDMSKTMLFNILMGKEKYDKGTIEWGKTIIPGYLPQDNTEYF